MCRWSPALLSNIRTGASPTPRGTETAADCPAANTVSNRSKAQILRRHGARWQGQTIAAGKAHREGEAVGGKVVSEKIKPPSRSGR